MDTHMKTTTLIGLLVVLTIIAGLLLSLSNIAKQQRILNISSYAECVKAGYPVMESYPERCATPDGRTFVNSAAPVTQAPETPEPIVANGCAVGGCSGQLCGEAGSELMSTCEYRAEYACYKQASCERQANGKCGWSETAALKSCISAAAASSAAL